MLWNKRFINTDGYPYVEKTVGIYPDLKSCRAHIEKHVLSPTEPWHLILDMESYQKTGQINDAIIVEIYEKIAPEITRSVHFCLVIESYVCTQEYQEQRVVGVGPLGLIVVLSPKNVVTAYFPGSTSQAGGEIQRFYKALNVAAKKQALNRSNLRAMTPSQGMNFSLLRFPWAKNQNSFRRFLSQYQNIEQLADPGEAIRNLVKEK